LKRSTTSWRTRAAAFGLAAAVVAAGLVLGGGTPALATTTQTGTTLKPNNYAGPGPCPGVTWNCTTDTDVIQNATTGENRFEASGTGGKAVQNNSSGKNTATCNLSSTAAVATLTCDFTQKGNGGNTITANEQASPSTGSVNLANVTQSSVVKLLADQSSDNGANTITATHTINQTAQSILDAATPVTHAQDSFELVNAKQVATTSGNNLTSLTLNRTQTSSATGATPTEKQDAGAIPADATVCGAAPLANGNGCVYQRSDTGTNKLTVRANDTKSATSNALLGATTQTQGTSGGGWLIRPDIDSAHNPSGGTVDLGTPPAPGGDCTTAPGIIKKWTLAGGGSGTRFQNDGIRLPIIGQSPWTATSNSCAKLVAPAGTKQLVHETADGHAKSNWTGALIGSAQSDQTIANRVDFSGQNVHASLSCSQNSPNTCSSVSANGTNVSGTEGAPITAGQVATFTDANTQDGAGAFTAKIDWGDGSPVDTGTVAGGNGSFTVAGTHTYTDEGSYPVTTTVSNNSDESVNGTAKSTATIADAPLTAAGTTLTSQTTQISGATLATFTDANPYGTASDFTATVNWGDGSDPMPADSITATDGGFVVKGTHKYASGGHYTVTVSIADAGGSATSATTSLQTSTVSVQAAAPSGVIEGTSFSGPVASFTDGNASDTAADFTATINWGDGQSSAGTVSGNGPFTVSGSHTYAEDGAYTITVGVTSTHDPAVAGTGAASASIGDAPIAVTGKTLVATGLSFSGTVATVTDSNPFSDGSDMTATIDWGDGQTSAGTVAPGTPGSAFAVSGSHTYSSAGTRTLTITVSDGGHSTASATSTLSQATCPSGGCFVIGDKSTSGTVTFWSNSWYTKNVLSGGVAPAQFQGWENSTATPTCGTSWTGIKQDGDSDDGVLPPSSVPVGSYMAVVVAGKVTKVDGQRSNGNTVKMVVVKVTSYTANWKSAAGTGTVVGTLCG